MTLGKRCELRRKSRTMVGVFCFTAMDKAGELRWVTMRREHFTDHNDGGLVDARAVKEDLGISVQFRRRAALALTSDSCGGGPRHR